MPVNKRNTQIRVSFQKEGVHKYPAAKDIWGVEFLQYPHRHMFHFYVQLEVFHDDREIEFILFKREMEGLFEKGVMQADYKSCEMMANDLLDYIEVNYPNRICQVEVYEDGENGAIVNNS